MRISKWESVQSGSVIFVVLGVLLLILALALFAIPRLSTEDEASTGVVDVEPAESATNGIIAFWEARASSSPGDFTALNELALAYIRRARQAGDVTDYSRAQAAVDASLASLPEDNYEALAVLASLQITRHEFAPALETARSAMALDHGDPFARAVAGDALLALGDYDAAFETYRELVAASPGLTSFSRLAHIHELRGEAPSADAAWQNAFNTDDGRRPENTAWARVQYGHFLFARGDLAGAATQYQSALQVFPGYVHALAAMARIAAIDGLYDEAAGLYEQVVSRQPVFEYVAALGDVYLVAGRNADAQRQYELVAAIDGLYRESGINTDVQMALFLADHGLRLEEAVDRASGSYQAHPNSIYTADALAWALHKASRDDEALPYTTRAVRLGTKDPLLLFHAGMINYQLGNKDGARDYLQQALDSNPQFSLLYSDEARETLDRIQASVYR